MQLLEIIQAVTASLALIGLFSLIQNLFIPAMLWLVATTSRLLVEMTAALRKPPPRRARRRN
jgi:hypothetical protein